MGIMESAWRRFSYRLLYLVGSTGMGRRAVEATLRSYYPKAGGSGLANVSLPRWYNWLNKYYFASLRKRLPNAEFQRKYWELGSLRQYHMFVVEQVNDPRIQRFLEVVIDHVRQLAQQQPKLKVLELGCGDGMPMKALLAAAQGAELRLYGIDISRQGLLLARDLVGQQAHLVRASATHLPFRSTFDLAFARGLFMFLDAGEAAAAISEVSRLCRRLILMEPALVRKDEVMEIATLDTSLERVAAEQRSWIHPYTRLAEASGGKVTAQEYVAGTFLMVAEWS